MRFAAILVAAIALLAAGCGDDGDNESSGGAATTAMTDTETTPAANAEAGKLVFTTNCGSCHTLSDAAATGTVGPNLDDLEPSEETVKNQVTNGGGGMPAFGGQLSEEEIAAVSAYVAQVVGG